MRMVYGLFLCLWLAVGAWGQAAAKTNSGREQGKYLTHADGTKTFYKVLGAKGKGVPLFVLHGGPGFDHLYFLGNSAFAEIGRERPVIFYDQRGSGRAARLTARKTLTVDDLLDDLEALRKHLGYEKIALAGHSWGGFLAMAYAARWPERLTHLILIDAPVPDYGAGWGFSDVSSKYPKEYGEFSAKLEQSVKTKNPKLLRESLVAYMKTLFYSPQKRDAFIAGSQNYTFNPQAFEMIGESALGLRQTLLPPLEKLKVPTLGIHGKYDVNVTPNATTEILPLAIPGSKIVVFDESGHLPFYEEPEKFVSTINEFLAAKAN